MDNPEQAVNNISIGEQKVDEYVRRIQEGESLHKILDGLPQVFRLGIAEKLLADKSIDESLQIRLEELGLIKRVSDGVKENVGDSMIVDNEDTPIYDYTTENKDGYRNMHELLSVEEREKISDWAASYELAKIADNEGVDLSTFSREEYAEYAITNGLAIGDNQLRASTWQRMKTSPEEIIAERKRIDATIPESQKNAFDKFGYEVKQKAASDNRYLYDGVRVRQGTKDSDSWFFFGINESLPENSFETNKCYLTFRNLSTFSPNRFSAFLEILQKAGYNGDVKVFQDLGRQATLLNDQVVMHGATIEDVQLANNLAQEFFGDELSAIGSGKDEVINEKNMSYSQILADDIKRKIAAKRIKIDV